jgi:hypothetical protein
MITLSLTISPLGPIVQVRIGLNAGTIQVLRSAGKAIPQAVDADALIDSGSDATCVDPSVLAPLRNVGLQHQTILLTHTPALGGRLFALEYDVGLRIVHPFANPKMDLVTASQLIIEQPLSALGYSVLIGRDVLAKCLFILDGPSNSFTLGY